MTRGSSSIAMRLLIATATRAIGSERAEPEDPTLPPLPPLPAIPPLPPVAVCSGCGTSLGRYHYTATGTDPSRKCPHCIKATPGRERMAAKMACEASEVLMFIVIEGADGTGKSTLAAKLANHLGATLTAEPSYGPIGWWVRENLSDLPAAALPYLFAADRAQHVTETIAPALAAGEIVVCDRYIPSSVAYQGLDAIALNTSFPMPDLTILLTVSPEIARQRIAARDALTPFEERHAADLGVRYVAALNALGWRYVTIDASAGIEEVLREAVEHVASAQREKALQGTPSPRAVYGAAQAPATLPDALSAPMATMRLLLTARERWKSEGVIVVTPPIAASHGEPWRATIVNYLGGYSANFSEPTEEALYQRLIGMAP